MCRWGEIRLPTIGNKTKYLLKAASTCILLILILKMVDWATVLGAIQRLSFGPAILVLILFLLHFLTSAFRWDILLGMPQVKRATNIKAFLCGVFLNTFTPSNLGNDAYRFLALKKFSPTGFYLFSCLVEERILGLCYFLMAYVCFALMTLLPSFSPTPPFFLYAALCCLAAVIVFFALPHANGLLRRFFGSYLPVSFLRLWEEANLGRSLTFSKEFTPLLALTGAGIVFWVSTAYVVSHNLGCPIPWATVAAISVLVELVRYVPLTVQGIGLREGAYAYFYHLNGYDAEIGFAVGTIVFILLNIAFCLSGLLSLTIPGQSGTSGQESG